MNEALIKELIRCKVNAAEAILCSLPTEVSIEIKKLGKVVLEGLNEAIREVEEPARKVQGAGKLEDIPIE